MTLGGAAAQAAQGNPFAPGAVSGVRAPTSESRRCCQFHLPAPPPCGSDPMKGPVCWGCLSTRPNTGTRPAGTALRTTFGLSMGLQIGPKGRAQRDPFASARLDRAPLLVFPCFLPVLCHTGVSLRSSATMSYAANSPKDVCISAKETTKCGEPFLTGRPMYVVAGLYRAAASCRGPSGTHMAHSVSATKWRSTLGNAAAKSNSTIAGEPCLSSIAVLCRSWSQAPHCSERRSWRAAWAAASPCRAESSFLLSSVEPSHRCKSSRIVGVEGCGPVPAAASWRAARRARRVAGCASGASLGAWAGGPACREGPITNPSTLAWRVTPVERVRLAAKERKGPQAPVEGRVGGEEAGRRCAAS